MSLLQRYSWEATHITSIVGLIVTMTVVAHLTGTPRVEMSSAGNATAIDPRTTSFSSVVTQSDRAALPTQPPSQQGETPPQQSDPRVVTVGPSGISNRYTLVSVDRKPVSSKRDDLIVRLHVDGLAAENWVSPFESGMLELSSRELGTINPKTPFHHPIPSGNTLNQDIVFSIPSSLTLNHTTLNIHYFNYQKEIPLNLPPRGDTE